MNQVFIANPIFDTVITVTGNSTEVTYDSNEHTAAGYVVTFTAGGEAGDYDALRALNFVVTARTEDPAATNVVQTATPLVNEVTNIVVTYNGVDVTDRMSGIIAVDGSLKINPKMASVVANGTSKPYAENDPVFTATPRGFLNNDAPTPAQYTVTRPGAGTDEAIGIYTNAIIVENNGYVNENYIVQWHSAPFEITHNPAFDITITITGNSTDVVYNATEHTASGYSINNSSGNASLFTITADTSNPTATNVVETETPLVNAVSNILYSRLDNTRLFTSVIGYNSGDHSIR